MQCSLVQFSILYDLISWWMPLAVGCSMLHTHLKKKNDVEAQTSEENEKYSVCQYNEDMFSSISIK